SPAKRRAARGFVDDKGEIDHEESVGYFVNAVTDGRHEHADFRPGRREEGCASRRKERRQARRREEVRQESGQKRRQDRQESYSEKGRQKSRKDREEIALPVAAAARFFQVAARSQFLLSVTISHISSTAFGLGLDIVLRRSSKCLFNAHRIFHHLNSHLKMCT